MRTETLTAARIAKFIKDGLPEGKSSAVLWAASPKGLGLRLREGLRELDLLDIAREGPGDRRRRAR